MDIRTWKDADQPDPSDDGVGGSPYRARHRSKRSPFSPLRPAPIAIGGMTTAAVAAIAFLAPHLFNPGSAASTRIDGLGTRVGPTKPSSTAPGGGSTAPTSDAAGAPSSAASGSPSSGSTSASSSSAGDTTTDATAGTSTTTPGAPSASTSTTAGSFSTPPQTSPTAGGPTDAPTSQPSTAPTTGGGPVSPPPTTTPPPTSTPPPSSSPPTAPPTTTPAPPTSTTPPIAPFNASTAQAQALAQIATARQNSGRGSLHVDSALTTVAAKHTSDMVTHNLFSHTGSNGSSPWDRAVHDAQCWNWYNEVIARGKPGDDVVGALLADPNSGPLLNQWGLQTIGISAQQDPKTGQVLWTIELGWS